jgi:O-antigen biosynthesis protein
MTIRVQPSTISFAQPLEPLVSVLIPVHNRLDLTLDCLDAIQRTSETSEIEVIVIDDASSDDTAAALQDVDGLIVVTLATCSGFQRAIQAGVERMSGRLLFMLNNDTQVHPGWLEALLDAVDSNPSIGAVGCKLLFPDGRLQEAGGIVWNDASAWNWGYRQVPDDPAFNYRREVDYASGAALLVRRDVFTDVGGFDVRFAPAYYEDVDLCFKIRGAGYKVVYEPGAVITHLGGQSYEASDAGALKEDLIATNAPLFAAKWRFQLDQHWSNGVGGGHRGGRIDHRPRVLVCDSSIPAFDTDAGGLRMTCILEHLVTLGCHVTLLPENGLASQPYTRRLQEHGVEVLYSPWGIDHLASQRAGLYDVVILSRPQVAAAYFDRIRAAFPGAMVVYDTVDLHHRREERRLALMGELPGPEHDELRRSELRLMRRADVVSAVSEVDAECVQRWVAGVQTVVLPTANPMPEEPRPGFEGRSGLVFIGGFQHPPNVDAMLWFVHEVLPLVRAQDPCTLTILGSKPPTAIRELSCEHITVTGYVRDVDPFFDTSLVFVAPLRYGAGIKGKVAHAMSLGLPVVTTAIGTEGMGIDDGVHALVRDSPQAFADAIACLRRDPVLWESLAFSGSELIRTTLSTDAMRVRLQLFLEDLFGLTWRGVAPGPLARGGPRPS